MFFALSMSTFISYQVHQLTETGGERRLIAASVHCKLSDPPGHVEKPWLWRWIFLVHRTFFMFLINIVTQYLLIIYIYTFYIAHIIPNERRLLRKDSRKLTLWHNTSTTVPSFVHPQLPSCCSHGFVRLDVHVTETWQRFWHNFFCNIFSGRNQET